MDSHLLEAFQQYGLSLNEAKVYLTTFQLGNSLASTIARRSGINRTTTYVILEKLKKQGMINEMIRVGVRYYQAIDPQVLLDSLEQKYESFKSIMPEVFALSQKFTSKTKVQFFEGYEAVKQMYQYLLESPETIRSFLGTHEVDEKLKEYLNKYFIPQRIKKGVKARVILCQSHDNKEYYQVNKKSLIETLFINHEHFRLPVAIDIHGEDKVSFVMFNTQEMSGLIVYSKKLHDTLASIFDFIRETNKLNGRKKT